MGSHRCLAAAVALARRKRFVLRLDLAKFFPSIDHALLAGMLRPRTPAAWWPVTERILSAPAHVGVRRWLLPTVRYHVYYRVDEAMLIIAA